MPSLYDYDEGRVPITPWTKRAGEPRRTAEPGWTRTYQSALLICLEPKDQPGKLVLGHRDLGTALEPVGSTTEERGTVRVHGLVAGGSALEAGLGGGVESRGSSSLGGLALLEVLDDSGLEGELDQVEREVPDDAEGLAKSSYLKDETHFQTQTIPIQPPEIARTQVNHQLP